MRQDRIPLRGGENDIAVLAGWKYRTHQMIFCFEFTQKLIVGRAVMVSEELPGDLHWKRLWVDREVRETP